MMAVRIDQGLPVAWISGDAPIGLEDQTGRSHVTGTKVNLSAMRRRPVAQQFDMGRRAVRRQRRDLDLWAIDAVEAGLPGSGVERPRSDSQTQCFIKRDTPGAIGNADRRMVDAQSEVAF